MKGVPGIYEHEGTSGATYTQEEQSRLRESVG